MKSLKICLLSFGLISVMGLVAFAQESPPEVTEAVNLDENIQPEDLGISEPTLLPDSPFYFLKNWGRGIQSFFTFNPVAKSELKNKFANEKLLELKKTIEQKKNQEAIKKAAENYQKGVEKMKKTTEAIKQKARESPGVDKFLNKFISQQTLHQKLLQKLEEQVPSEAFEKIKETREAHLEGFQSVLLKLEDRQDKITEKLNEAMEKQKGSEFKEFKNLEVLKNLEEKVPEQAKEAIQKAQENTLKRLQGDLEKMSSENQEKFKEYAEKISGAKEEHLEILENLKTKIREALETPKTIELKERLEEGKTKIFEKIEKGLEKVDCPLWTPPAPGFCKEGRMIMEKNPQTDCPLPPKCIIPGEVEIPEKPTSCITLWDPVCGKNGKTYSNKCFAEIAKVEIDYEGICKVPPATGITPKPGVCIQVITPAISPDGICKEFPNPCVVPEGWKKVDKCPE